MRRQSMVAGVALACLLLGVSACGGSDDKADPKRMKTKTSPSPAAPAQPSGANGVTYDIQNWEDYADDAAVLAYKQAAEALSASVNQRKPVAGVDKLVAKPVLRLLVGNLVNIKKHKWHVQEVAHILVQSARTSGTMANIVTCEWAPSTDLYDRNDKLVGKVKREWRRYAVTLSSASGSWVLQPLKQVGTCPGGAPA